MTTDHLAAAKQDAAEAVLDHLHPLSDECECGHRYEPDRLTGRIPLVQIASHISRVAIDAAEPHIRAAIAAVIRREALYVAPSTFADGMTAAARIAEGTP